MYIERNGVRYELTQEELKKAYEEYEHDKNLQIAKSYVEFEIENLVEEGVLDTSYQIDMSLLEELVNANKEEIFRGCFGGFDQMFGSENWDCVVDAYLSSEGLK